MEGSRDTAGTVKPSNYGTAPHALLLFLLIVSGAIVRLIPVLVTGEPFSTDVWPVINLAKRVSMGAAPPLPQATHSNTAYVWPGLPLTMAMYYALVGLGDERVIVYLFTALITASFSVMLLAWLKGAYPFGAYYAVVYALFFPSFLLMTSAPLKEFLGLTLVMGALHMMSSSRRWNYPLMTMLLMAAVFTHLVPTAVMLVSVFLASFIASSGCCGVVKKRVIAYSSTVLSVLVIYNLVMFRKIVMVFKPLDIIVYTISVLAVLLLYLKVPRTSKVYSKFAFGALVASATLIFIAVFIRFPIMIGAESPSLLLFFIPALIGVVILFSVGNREFLSLAKSMLLVIGASALYLMLWKTGYLMIVHRILNYLFFVGAIPLALIAERRKRIALAIVIVVIASSSVALFDTIAGYDPMTSYWVYRPSEVGMYTSLNSIAPGRNFLGDERLMYFFLDSLENVSVSVRELFKVLQGNGCSARPKEAIVSWFNKEVGFVGIVNIAKAELRESSRLVSYGSNVVIAVDACGIE